MLDYQISVYVQNVHQIFEGELRKIQGYWKAKRVGELIYMNHHF